MAADSSALLRPPLAYVQSPSYSKDDQEQGGSIEDAPDLVPPDEPPYTPTDPGTEASCLERYQYNLGTCYAGALAAVNEERRTLINACYADHQGAIDAAMTAVEDAEKDVVAMQKGLYQPAEPLILTLPVAHCNAGRYILGDQVLIDFPVRVPGPTGMGVWNSARVIGWAAETRACRYWDLVYYDVNRRAGLSYGLTFIGEQNQSVADLGNGTAITAVSGISQEYYVSQRLYHKFWEWTDHLASPTRQDSNITESLQFGAKSKSFNLTYREYTRRSFDDNPETGGTSFYLIVTIIDSDGITEAIRNFDSSEVEHNLLLLDFHPLEDVPYSSMSNGKNINFAISYLDTGLAMSYTAAPLVVVDETTAYYDYAIVI